MPLKYTLIRVKSLPPIINEVSFKQGRATCIYKFHLYYHTQHGAQKKVLFRPLQPRASLEWSLTIHCSFKIRSLNCYCLDICEGAYRKWTFPKMIVFRETKFAVSSFNNHVNYLWKLIYRIELTSKQCNINQNTSICSYSDRYRDWR